MLYYREKEKAKLNLFSIRFFALLCLAFLSTFFLPSPPDRTNLNADLHPRPSQKNSIPPASTYAPLPDFDLKEPSFTEPAVGVLTSPFGNRWGRNHNGIDIGAEQGSDIIAADSGYVLLSEWVDGYGNYLIIDHGNGFETAYAHCSELLVSQGTQVCQGQIIALVGSTGNSTGPHLHFEIKLDGIFQDPLNYVIY